MKVYIRVAVGSFFAYAFFRQKYIENLDNMQLKEITNYADIICSKLGKLTNQRNTNFFVMGHPFDSIIPMCQEAPILYYISLIRRIQHRLATIVMHLPSRDKVDSDKVAKPPRPSRDPLQPKSQSWSRQSPGQGQGQGQGTTKAGPSKTSASARARD